MDASETYALRQNPTKPARVILRIAVNIEKIIVRTYPLRHPVLFDLRPS
jgi:hypothetical protein